VAPEDPERAAILRERTELVRQTLEKLSARDPEILVRLYIREQTPQQICCEMGLTETQFRLCKSRAKSKFGELGKKELNRRSPDAIAVRKGNPRSPLINIPRGA
jgi:DNA-directed RNA polymerase specialized sigma24 family protein